MTELKLITYVPKNLEEIKKTNLHVSKHGYYKIDDDPDCAVRDFEVGNSHLKVDQTYDMKPGEVKHIDPADYDGSQRSRKLEATHKANKQQLKKEYLEEADAILDSYEAWYDGLDRDLDEQTPEYDSDSVYIGPMDSQDTAYQY